MLYGKSIRLRGDERTRKPGLSMRPAYASRVSAMANIVTT
jgi:hypothetical protein